LDDGARLERDIAGKRFFAYCVIRGECFLKFSEAVKIGGFAIVKKPPNPIDRHVGSRVRMKRKLLGMSQEKLGEALGLTFQQVQKYEKGSNRIGASRLQEIAKILGEQPSFFFEGAPQGESLGSAGFAEAPSSEYVVDFISSVEGLQLNRAFAAIKDAKVRKRIVDLVVSIAGSDVDGDAAGIVPLDNSAVRSKER
jgi:transcriptional regulator with XRE-family HTH domain